MMFWVYSLMARNWEQTDIYGDGPLTGERVAPINSFVGFGLVALMIFGFLYLLGKSVPKVPTQKKPLEKERELPPSPHADEPIRPCE
jgi:hypothetical protein